VQFEFEYTTTEKVPQGLARQNLITSKFLPKIALNRPGANSPLPKILVLPKNIYTELMLCDLSENAAKLRIGSEIGKISAGCTSCQEDFPVLKDDWPN